MASPTLALVCASIHTGASRGLWEGFARGALSRSASVLCFPVGRVGAPDDFEWRRNSLVGLVGPANVDAVACWTTSLSGCVAPAQVEAFVRSLSALPLVSMSQGIAGAPLVAFDAYSGMRSLVEHLVDVHGLERIAFVRGPESHISAEERFRAYVDTLKSRGLALDERLVAGPLSWDGGREAARCLLDQRQLRPGRDFDAVVAASDLLAFWVLEEFLARGIEVPEDVALAGFNDSRESALSSPPLTTVAVDFGAEGRAAADLLARTLAGGAVPAETFLPTRLKARRSCGCPRHHREDGPPRALAAAGPERRAALLELSSLFGLGGGPVDWLDALVDALAHGFGGDGGRGFLSALEVVLDRCSSGDSDPEGWQGALSLLRGGALAQADMGGGRILVEEVFHRARALAADAALRSATYSHWLADQSAAALREAGAAILACHDLPSLAATLRARLPALGIPRGWLVLDEGRGAPARLVEEGRELSFPPGLVLPDRRHLEGAPGAFIVEPLSFRDEVLGRLVLEVGPAEGAVYEELRGYVSGALRGAALFAETEVSRARAERADRIKTGLLAGLSRELRAPLERIAAEAAGAGDCGARIAGEATRQLDLVDDLLGLARADSGELALALEVVEPGTMLAASMPRGCQLALPETMPLLPLDPVLMGKALANILSRLAPEAGTAGMLAWARVSIESGGLRVEIGGPAATPMQNGGGDPFDEDRDPRLAYARRVLALHGASLDCLGGGCGFLLPFPTLSGAAATQGLGQAAGAMAAVLSSGGLVSAAAASLAGRLGLRPQALSSAAEDMVGCAAIIWDLAASSRSDLRLAGELSRSRLLGGLPLLAFGSAPPSRTSAGAGPALGFLRILERDMFHAQGGGVLVVAAGQSLRAALEARAASLLPGSRVRSFRNWIEAGEGWGEAFPSVALVDLRMGLERLGGLAPSSVARPDLPLVVFAEGGADSWGSLPEAANVVLLPLGVMPPQAVDGIVRRCAMVEMTPHRASVLARRAAAWLLSNAASPVSRAELAGALGVNEDYLGRVFRKEYGLSPWEYLGNCRVRKAQELLGAGANVISSVAREAGFSDQAYFSRAFRRCTGLSPMAWINRRSDEDGALPVGIALDMWHVGESE